MLKEKRLYLILLVLLAFAFLGERAKLQEDMSRASVGIVRMLQVEEVVEGWHSLVDTAAAASQRLVKSVSAEKGSKRTSDMGLNL